MSAHTAIGVQVQFTTIRTVDETVDGFVREGSQGQGIVLEPPGDLLGRPAFAQLGMAETGTFTSRRSCIRRRSAKLICE